MKQGAVIKANLDFKIGLPNGLGSQLRKGKEIESMLDIEVKVARNGNCFFCFVAFFLGQNRKLYTP